MRKCINCKGEISFEKRKGTIYCTPVCKKAFWDKNNRTKRRELNKENTRKWRYGLSNKDYEFLLEKQDNRCAICLFELKHPRIDHCHKSGMLREILCNKCNMGLGMFNEDLNLLHAAISYLTKHNVSASIFIQMR